MVSGKLSHSSDEFGACICSNVDLHVRMCDSVHCGYVVNGSVAMAAVSVLELCPPPELLLNI